MSLAETEYRIALKNIVDVLKVMAGADDSASVQINNGGTCILRVGCSHSEHLSIDAFAKVLDEEMTRHLDSDNPDPT